MTDRLGAGCVYTLIHMDSAELLWPTHTVSSVLLNGIVMNETEFGF